MHEAFTRTLERRGIYTGAIPRWALPTPSPAFYLIVNRRNTGMVRIEVGVGRRAFYLDWGLDGNRD